MDTNVAGNRRGLNLQPRCPDCGGFKAPGAEKCPRCEAHPKIELATATGDRICRKCGLAWPVDVFNRDAKTRDGLSYWCRSCKSDNVKRRRRGLTTARMERQGGIPGDWKKGQRGLSPAMEAQVWRLLGAAQRAASTGLWRGRPAIQAYRDLRVALDEWRVPESERVLTGEESPIILKETA